MKTAIVTGITGQDGSYLAELLLAKDYHVVGAVRSSQHPCELLYPRLMHNNIEFVAWDMLDQLQMIEVLAEFRPTEIYNFAAYSSGAAMFDDPIGIGEVNGIAVARILEAIRIVDSSIRFCQASSSELFGEVVESPQLETTPFHPRTPYGAAKLYAHSMIDIYRQRYGMFVCSAILFNHESPRRGLNFVTRKVARAAAAIKLGDETELVLGTLDARRDWGFAGDYVSAMQLMLQQPKPDDYVVATGITHSVRELCDIAFGHVGLDYRDFVKVNPDHSRVPETLQLVGDASKARSQLAWKPLIAFEALIKMMVDEEIKNIENSRKLN